MKKQLTRRDVNRALGLAGSSLLLAPGLARAATGTPAQTEGPFYPTPTMRRTDVDNDLVKVLGSVQEAGGEVVSLNDLVAFYERAERP